MTDTQAPHPRAPQPPRTGIELRRAAVSLAANNLVISALSSEALRFLNNGIARDNLLVGILECIRDAVDYASDCQEQEVPHSTIVAFAARRMACLFYLLKKSGILSHETEARLSQLGVQIQSDRFMLLHSEKDLPKICNTKVFLCDDTRVTGSMITLLTNQIRHYQLRAAEAIGATPPPHVDSRSLITAHEGSVDPIKLDAASLQKGLALTLASGGVPLFTDFPISSELRIKSANIGEYLRTLDPNYLEVTNASAALSDNRAYSLRIEPILSKAKDPEIAELVRQFNAISHVIKLRVFARETDKRQARIRAMVKIILKDIDTEAISKIVKTLDFWIPDRNTGNKQTRDEILKQAFAYFEYLVSHFLFEKIAPLLQDSLPPAENGEAPIMFEIDHDLTRYIMGRSIPSEHYALRTIRKCISFIPPSDVQDTPATSTEGPARASFGSIVIGDDWAKLADNALTSRAAELRGATLGYRYTTPDTRVARHDVIYTFTELMDVLPKQQGDELFKHFYPSPAFRTAAALDGLNDYGRIVPTQTILHGKVCRGYKLGECSLVYDQLTPSATGGKLMPFRETIVRRDSSGVDPKFTYLAKIKHER